MMISKLCQDRFAWPHSMYRQMNGLCRATRGGPPEASFNPRRRLPRAPTVLEYGRTDDRNMMTIRITCAATLPLKGVLVHITEGQTRGWRNRSEIARPSRS